MKRILLASAGLFALMAAAPANAADIAPVYKAPPVVYSSWTGLYVGVALGAKWGDIDWTTTCLGLTGPGGCPAATVFPIDASSPRNFDPTSFRAGGYVGYNWQFAPNWLVGLEADLAWADDTKTTPGIPGCTIGCIPGFVATTVDSSSFRLLWDASIRGRVGFIPLPDVLIYATGGLAAQAVEANLACTVTGPWCVTTRNQTLGETLTGWTVGGGLEYKWGNWVLRGEYRYSEFQNFQPTFFGNTTDDVYADIKVRTHIATAGIAYLFNWGGPVVAKY